jgi:opacity protein-like surface antigen
MFNQFKSRTLLVSGLCMGILASADALADDGRLGLYAGGGVGYSTLDQWADTVAGPLHFPGDRVGWKLGIGVRPLSWLGSELEYIDFGAAHIGASTGPSYGLPAPTEFYGADANARAGALFAVGYLPLAVNWMDVFGKVGYAYLRTSASAAGNFPNTYINCQVACMPLGQASGSVSDHSTGFAYGGGVQFHFGRLALRLEYESMNSTLVSNPQLATIGLTWKF